MYKCTECGCEFENKPDFCDCGNDEFVLVEEQEEKPKAEDTVIPSVPKEENIKQESKEPIQTALYTDERFVRPPVDILSLGIFLTCIVLSFVVIFFLWNPKDDETQKMEENLKPISQNIPSSIDKIWNNALPKIVSETKPVERQKSTEETKVIKVVQQQAKPAVPQVKTTAVKKQTSPVSTAKTETKTAAQKTQTASKSVQTTQHKSVQQQKPVQSKPQTETKLTLTTVQNTATPTPTQQSTPVTQTVPAKSSQELAQELANYKASLRNTIGRKIDFTRVIGDGSCAISFKINESGKLINRSFSQQSTNMTLNDAVYAAMMSTPNFSAPPEGYKNEFMKLTVKFYNGNFQISLD